LASFASDVSSCVAVPRLASAWPAAPRVKKQESLDEAKVSKENQQKNIKTFELKPI